MTSADIAAVPATPQETAELADSVYRLVSADVNLRPLIEGVDRRVLIAAAAAAVEDALDGKSVDADTRAPDPYGPAGGWYSAEQQMWMNHWLYEAIAARWPGWWRLPIPPKPTHVSRWSA